VRFFRVFPAESAGRGTIRVFKWHSAYTGHRLRLAYSWKAITLVDHDFERKWGLQ
jgi:hypothetical protein